MENITNVSITDWIIAVSTCFYTVGTIFLWYITYKTMKRNETLLKMNNISIVYKNFREIYTQILNDKNNAKHLAKELSLSIEESKKVYMATFLINHVFEMYSLYKCDLLPKEFWERVVVDMNVLFEWSFIKSRWEKMKILFPSEFSIFIDNNVLRCHIF